MDIACIVCQKKWNAQKFARTDIQTNFEFIIVFGYVSELTYRTQFAIIWYDMSFMQHMATLLIAPEEGSGAVVMQDMWHIKYNVNHILR